jgi:hypothetical protein
MYQQLIPWPLPRSCPQNLENLSRYEAYATNAGTGKLASVVGASALDGPPGSRGSVVRPERRTRVNASFVLFAASVVTASPAVPPNRLDFVRTVRLIQRADYEGDRTALQRLYAQLTPPSGDESLSSRVRYWRGFALWRRAINGFNDQVDPKELETDLQQALGEFDRAAQDDPRFIDAKVGSLSCLSLLAFSVNLQDRARQQELITRGRQVAAEAQQAAPDNPRLLWVMGPNVWYAPPERGGSQAKAIEMYEKGLETARKHPASPAADSLEPTWGEAELLMNLAWSELNKTTPDIGAADRYARAALELVPNWHYVRDILIPQIDRAKTPRG